MSLQRGNAIYYHASTESPQGKQLKNKCRPDRTQKIREKNPPCFSVQVSCRKSLGTKPTCSSTCEPRLFILCCSGPEETERDVWSFKKLKETLTFIGPHARHFHFLIFTFSYIFSYRGLIRVCHIRFRQLS